MSHEFSMPMPTEEELLAMQAEVEAAAREEQEIYNQMLAEDEERRRQRGRGSGPVRHTARPGQMPRPRPPEGGGAACPGVHAGPPDSAPPPGASGQTPRDTRPGGPPTVNGGGSGNGGSGGRASGSGGDIPPPSPEEVYKALRRNQLGDAELFISQNWELLRYDHTLKLWFVWDGHRWIKDGNDTAFARVTDLASIYEGEAWGVHHLVKNIQEKKVDEPRHRPVEMLMEDEKELHKRARQLRSESRANGVMRMAAAGRGSLGITGMEWDREPTLLVCRNSVIDLETGRSYAGRPGQYLRKASPIEYHGLNAEAPHWDDARRKILCMDEEIIDYMDRIIGYCVTGLMTHKEFWCAYGPGGDNGKSFFFETILWAMGEYGASIPVSLLLDQYRQNNSGPDPEMLRLDGLRLAVASEAKRGSKFSMERIKLMTGSDGISVRGLYMKEPIEFKPQHKMWLHSNWIPQVQGNDPAFFKRLRVLRFGARFTRDQKQWNESRFVFPAVDQETMTRTMKAEGPGILAYLVRCAMRYLRDGDLTPPPSVVMETDDYREEQDLIGEWIADRCNTSPDLKQQAKELHDDFLDWCEQEKGMNRDRCMKMRSFGEDLQTRFRKVKTNKVYYHGVGLKASQGEMGQEV